MAESRPLEAVDGTQRRMRICGPLAARAARDAKHLRGRAAQLRRVDAVAGVDSTQRPGAGPSRRSKVAPNGLRAIRLSHVTSESQYSVDGLSSGGDGRKDAYMATPGAEDFSTLHEHVLRWMGGLS